MKISQNKSKESFVFRDLYCGIFRGAVDILVYLYKRSPVKSIRASANNSPIVNMDSSRIYQSIAFSDQSHRVPRG